MRVIIALAAVVFAGCAIVLWHDKRGVTAGAVVLGLFSASWALLGLRRWLDLVVSSGQIALAATSVALGVLLSTPALIWLGVFIVATGVRGVADGRKAETRSRKQRPHADTLNHTFLDK